jgi:MFS superfamily sulfate permease-like transporter
MADKHPRRPRSARLLMPFVLAGAVALVAGWLRLPRAIGAIPLVILLWLVLSKGYGP